MRIKRYPAIIFNRVYPSARQLLLMAVVFLAACESKWEKMPDDELAAKAAECQSIPKLSSAMAQVCKNYERECERRRKSGIYIC